MRIIDLVYFGNNLAKIVIQNRIFGNIGKNDYRFVKTPHIPDDFAGQFGLTTEKQWAVKVNPDSGVVHVFGISQDESQFFEMPPFFEDRDTALQYAAEKYMADRGHKEYTYSITKQPVGFEATTVKGETISAQFTVLLTTGYYTAWPADAQPE